MLQPTEEDYNKILTEIVLSNSVKVNAENLYKSNAHLDRTIFKIILDVLISYKLITDVSNHNYEMYSITPLGYDVVKESNFKVFREKEEKKIAAINRRNNLELLQLEQSVLINKYQFWFMIIGAVGGVISFIYLTCQFIIQLTSL